MFNVLTKIIHFINNQKKKQENISFQRFPSVVIFAHCVCQNAHPFIFPCLKYNYYTPSAKILKQASYFLLVYPYIC